MVSSRVDPQTAKAPPVSMDLVRLFVQVAAKGSIAAAARELDVSPSLATRRLVALERALKTRLFQRTTRSVKLTEGGGIALRWATDALENYARVSDDLAAAEGRPAGLIRIAATEYAAMVVLPRFLAQFGVRFPQIRFSIATTDSIVKLVEEGYDVALHSGLVPDANVVGVRLRDVRRILCASPVYLRRRGVPSKLKDLTQHDCLVHGPTEPKNWFFKRRQRLTGQAVNAYVTLDDHLALVAMARSGLGIIRVSLNAVREDLHSGQLVQVLPEYECVYPTGELPGMWIMYPNRRLPFRTRVFVDALTRYLRNGLGA